MPTIEEILQDRGHRNGQPGPHGEWSDNAQVSQHLKAVLRAAMRKRHAEKIYPDHDAIHMEAMDMITMKLARIATGDADFEDHWKDIAGYATLCAERLGPDMRQRAASGPAVASPAAAAAPARPSAPAPASTRPVAPSAPPAPTLPTGMAEILKGMDDSTGSSDFGNKG